MEKMGTFGSRRPLIHVRIRVMTEEVPKRT